MVIEEALKFIESDEMREYLQRDDVDVALWQWAMLVAQSRASLSDKASALQKITENPKYFDKKEELRAVDWKLKKVLSAIEETTNVSPGSVFSLTKYWIDDEVVWINDGRKFFGNYYKKEKSLLFTTFERALHFISMDNFYTYGICGNEIPDDTSTWYEITRWDRLDDGENMSDRITWLLGHSGIIWGFDKVYDRWTWSDDGFNIGLGGGIELPTPFKPGDIVVVDMRPFTDSFHAVILWTDDVDNKHSPICMFINRAGNVEVGAINYLSPHPPCFSPLLRAKRYNGKLFGREIPLKFISECLKKDYLLGEKMRNMVFDKIKDGAQRINWFEIKNLLTEKLKIKLEKVRLQADLNTSFGPFETVEEMNAFMDAMDDLLED